MKRLLFPNINRKGRLVRATIAVALLAGSAFVFPLSRAAAGAMIASGLFMVFEALRGWCLIRACGIKTRL